MVYSKSSILVIGNHSQHCVETPDVSTIQKATYAGVYGTFSNRLTGHHINDLRFSSTTGVVFNEDHMIY